MSKTTYLKPRVMAVQGRRCTLRRGSAYPLPEGRKRVLPESVSDGPFDNVFRVGVSQENGLTNTVSMAISHQIRFGRYDLVELSILKICPDLVK
jgi:hypothetical protein